MFSNFCPRVVLFVFDDRAFSFLLLCLGSILPLEILRHLIVYCIALYCTGLDYLD